MPSLTSDVRALQPLREPVIAYRHEFPTWFSERPRHDVLNLHYEAGNALTTALPNVELLKESLAERWLFDQPPAQINEALLLAERSLAEDWLRPEEDEAWAHLQ